MATLTEEQLLEEGKLAHDLLGANVSPRQVEKDLVEHGVDRETAREMVERIVKMRIERDGESYAREQAGTTHMALGAIVCTIGIGIAIYAYAMDADSSLYFAALGVLALGLFRLFRGAMKRS